MVRYTSLCGTQIWPVYWLPSPQIRSWYNALWACPNETTWYPHLNVFGRLTHLGSSQWYRNKYSQYQKTVLSRPANAILPLPNIASQTVERVTTHKLLGVHIDSTLSWSTHIEHIIKKATTRLHFLKQLKRSGLSNSHLLHFYITVTRPVLQYPAPMWHKALTKAQSESVGSLQKRAIHITHNQTLGMTYSSMLPHANLLAMAARRFFVTLWILPPVFTASFLHPDLPLSPKAQNNLLKVLLFLPTIYTIWF